jgi:hypothetical protein
MKDSRKLFFEAIKPFLGNDCYRSIANNIDILENRLIENEYQDVYVKKLIGKIDRDAVQAVIAAIDELEEKGK